MKFPKSIQRLSNDLRRAVQATTQTVDDGESVAILLWWGFLNDHARCTGINVEQLAREQLEAFIPWARDNVKFTAED